MKGVTSGLAPVPAHPPVPTAFPTALRGGDSSPAPSPAPSHRKQFKASSVACLYPPPTCIMKGVTSGLAPVPAHPPVPTAFPTALRGGDSSPAPSPAPSHRKQFKASSVACLYPPPTCIMKGVTSGLAPVPAHPPVPTAFPTALRGGDSSPAPSPAPSHRKQFKASSVACLYPPPTCIMKGVTSGLAPVPAHPPVPTAFPTALRGGDSSPAPSPAPSHRKQFKASSVACLYPPPTCIMKGVTSGLAPVPAHPPVPTAFPTALRGGDSSPAPSPAPSHRKQFKASSVACLYPPPTCIMKGVTSGLAPVPAHPPVPTAFPTALRGGDSSPAPSPAPSHRKQFKASSVACLYPPPTCIMKGVTSGLAPVPAHPPVPTAFPTALRGGDSSPAPSPAPSHRKQFKASSVAWNHHGQDGTSTALTLISVPLSLQMSSGFREPQAIQFLLFKSTPEYGDILEEGSLGWLTGMVASP
ncbi:uncharacterized protein LOC128915152 isoform X3 [Rissa tridactyla]|uniref:uncharacterized protein LOC128915152 isoform X3 n=2 Tax=Rissa tridactyla TaxID=75485 RepID=UPI0023BB115D|nr:uncharacterized protein LOC128915152 isoform X3 [Rissa tridactyla]